MISRASLQHDDNGEFVWRVNGNDNVERRQVILGSAADRERILITEGLSVGDTVVRSSESTLGAGQKVKTN
jgi:hypothetical protein